MHLIISILNLLYFALSQSHEPTVNDLECFNDYDKEIVCHMKNHTCYDYRLSIQKEMCNFTHTSCKCNFQFSNSFLPNEHFNAVVWREEKFLFTKEIYIAESIKPKRPTIASVKQRENGNFLITLETHYTNQVFIESLTMELNYSDKAGNHMESIFLNKGKTEHEVVGRKLQPNSDYVVIARAKLDYNSVSDYSEPYVFSTPTSLQNILKIIIPISCITLVLFTSTIFYCYVKLRRELWEKLPTPKITSTFQPQIHILPHFENEFSPLHVENSMLDQTEHKPCRTSSSLAEVNNGHCHDQSLGTHVVLALEDHFQRHPGSEHQHEEVQTSMSYNRLENLQSTPSMAASNSESEKVSGNSGKSAGMMFYSNRTHFSSASNSSSLRTQIEKSSQNSTNVTPNSSKGHMNLSMKISNSDIHVGNISGSSFWNKNYMKSYSGDSYFLNRSIAHPASSKSMNEVSEITPDFEYDPSFGCSGSAHVIQTQLTCSRTELVVVPEYQSTNGLLGHGNKPEAEASVKQASRSHHNDIKRIMAKPACFKNSEDDPFPACESGVIIQVDEGYQPFQGLDQCTELKQNISQSVSHHHNKNRIGQQVLSSESLCSPALHVFPGIQIDCSYQKHHSSK